MALDDVDKKKIVDKLNNARTISWKTEKLLREFVDLIDRNEFTKINVTTVIYAGYIVSAYQNISNDKTEDGKRERDEQYVIIIKDSASSNIVYSTYGMTKFIDAIFVLSVLNEFLENINYNLAEGTSNLINGRVKSL